jgi:hypothetical protein
MKSSIVSIIMAVLLVFAQGTWSAETLLSKLSESCKADVAMFCSNVQPKRMRLLSCIYSHDDVISFECGMALNQATLQAERGVDEWFAILSACEADYESHCPTSRSGEDRILRCLSFKVHKMGGVSRGCRLALQEAGLL